MTSDAVARAESRVGKPTALLEVRSLTKRFGEVLANSDVDLTVMPGTVHGLIGENGAGKSTLLKMIYGVYTPDDGRMFVDGCLVAPGNPADARGLGIGMVFQDLRLVPALTVAENIALALPEGPTLKLKALSAKIEAASKEFGLAVDPTAKVRHLSIGERQRAEILKVLMTGARLVILDEPTSVLAPQEVEALLTVVASLRDQGLGIVLVTHKLNEVRAIADQVTVLRGGQAVLDVGRPQGVLRRGARRGDGRPARAAAVARARARAGERACGAGDAGRDGARRPRARRAQGRGPRGAPR